MIFALYTKTDAEGRNVYQVTEPNPNEYCMCSLHHRRSQFARNSISMSSLSSLNLSSTTPSESPSPPGFKWAKIWQKVQRKNVIYTLNPSYNEQVVIVRIYEFTNFVSFHGNFAILKFCVISRIFILLFALFFLSFFSPLYRHRIRWVITYDVKYAIFESTKTLQKT